MSEQRQGAVIYIGMKSAVIGDFEGNQYAFSIRDVVNGASVQEGTRVLFTPVPATPTKVREFDQESCTWYEKSVPSVNPGWAHDVTVVK